ncbi:MAG: cell division topological specificity factor MinE [Peptococcaceae bacterium]|nr:cell division topological specificity factor MinE [Peptococcaceae bacterium]
MASFLQRLFGGEKASKELAKDRLKLVLIHDRASVSPAMMENLRRDLVEVISKYMPSMQIFGHKLFNYIATLSFSQVLI